MFKQLKEVKADLVVYLFVQMVRLAQIGHSLNPISEIDNLEIQKMHQILFGVANSLYLKLLLIQKFINYLVFHLKLMKMN